MVLGLALSVRGGAGADAPAAGAERLAFVAETTGSQEVHVVDVTPSTTTRVARALAEVESLTWSPDGARLAFSARSGGPSSVFVVQSDGTQLRSLATGRSPSWSRR